MKLLLIVALCLGSTASMASSQMITDNMDSLDITTADLDVLEFKLSRTLHLAPKTSGVSTAQHAPTPNIPKPTNRVEYKYIPVYYPVYIPQYIPVSSFPSQPYF